MTRRTSSLSDPIDELIAEENEEQETPAPAQVTNQDSLLNEILEELRNQGASTTTNTVQLINLKTQFEQMQAQMKAIVPQDAGEVGQLRTEVRALAEMVKQLATNQAQTQRQALPEGREMKNVTPTESGTTEAFQRYLVKREQPGWSEKLDAWVYAGTSVKGMTRNEAKAVVNDGINRCVGAFFEGLTMGIYQHNQKPLKPE